MSTQTPTTPTQSQGLLRPDTADTQGSPSTPSSDSSDSLMKESYPDYTDKDVLKAPWKYIGYRVFSKWIASDQSFFIVRRFGALQARVVLSLQDEIVRMEEELDSMDKAYSRKAVPKVVDNGSFRNDPWSERGGHIKKICEKLKYYNEFINEYSQLMSRPGTRSEDIDNVRNWLGMDQLDPEKQAINKDEAAFINRRHDLIPVLPKKLSWFRKVLERSLILRIPLLRTCFERKCKDIEDYKDIRGIKPGETGALKPTIWQNDKRVDYCSSSVIAVVGLGMLIAPLWILEQINHDRPSARLGAITGFIVVFFLLVAVATTARVFDALAATAAYSAVLMVFIQLGSSN
ncbi:uncharacterized protein PAC_18423 [Phialocephala subalpina]|uniref:DUF6594 domain-containing protein n=1 Tax=Phialocephala subalpina TaxID=576137 RepID=A0A1L7XU12_9HELO|nr:uncharacterized protein PAC_18423 [Phialocephala subalpina]